MSCRCGVKYPTRSDCEQCGHVSSCGFGQWNTNLHGGNVPEREPEESSCRGWRHAEIHPLVAAHLLW
jgi:hypothetical protein